MKTIPHPASGSVNPKIRVTPPRKAVSVSGGIVGDPGDPIVGARRLFRRGIRPTLNGVVLCAGDLS